MNYGYGDPDWGDLLTSYNGQTITYDTIGNPLSDGTWTYTWEHGRELASMTSTDTTVTYTYNADGMRLSKTVNGTVYSYVYNGSQLTQMTVGENTLRFAYDASGLARTVTWNDTVYYYATNLQGDIIAILDADGNAVVEYTYDAWGNIYSVSGSLAETFGVLNPLRYRGYVYDNETKLYYLQSRYYNPEIGRFINADAYISTGQGFIGNNMFAYCNNSSVNCFDPMGEDAIWLQDTTTVYSAGHTGLLLEDAEGKWWHFYWGNNRDGAKGKSGDGKILLRYSGKLNLSSINTFYQYHYGKRYEKMIYFEGDFSNSVSYAKELSSNRYNLIINNCMQVSTDVLRKGTFTQSNAAYKGLLAKLRLSTVPNIAYNRMLILHNTVKYWHNTPAFLRSPDMNPLKVMLWI